MPSIYGNIKTEGDVRHATEETLRLWLPSYLGEVAAQKDLDRDTLPMIRSWKAVPTFDQWPEDQLPAAIVVTPGTNNVPERLNREFTVDWSVGVAVVVSAKDEVSTADLIGYYAAAVRVLMIQKGSLGGFAEETHWMSERFDEHPIPEQSRTLRTAMVMFSVTVAGMNQRYGGPANPGDPTEDPGSWPTIETVTATLVKHEVDEDA